jgi:hypothetical protein
MASLLVVIVSKINTIQGVRGIGIRWIGLIVGLDVSSKSILTMLVVVKILLMQNHTRTVILRDSILGKEEIQLLGRIIDENLDHDARETIIQWAVVSSTDSFLNNSVVALGFRDMLLWTCIIHLNSKFES